MATDKSPPQNGKILGFTLLSVTTLVVVQPALQLYYTMMMEQREQREVLQAPTYRLDHLRASEQQALNGGSMPIDQAMAAVSRNRVASALIEPHASNEGAPIIGWTQLPEFVSTANKSWTPPPPPPPPAPVEAAPADGTLPAGAPTTP